MKRLTMFRNPSDWVLKLLYWPQISPKWFTNLTKADLLKMQNIALGMLTQVLHWDPECKM